MIGPAVRYQRMNVTKVCKRCSKPYWQVGNYSPKDICSCPDGQKSGDSLRQVQKTLDIHSRDVGSNPTHRTLRLRLITTKKELEDFKTIIPIYHTYKKETAFVGRQINWIIEDKETLECFGVIGVGSAIMAMKPRDDYIGWNKEIRLKNLTRIANNWRFCLMKKGIGSKVLSLLHKEAPREWKKKYKERLLLLETLVEPPYEGTCYKASGWVLVGKTKGFQYEWIKKEDIKPHHHITQKYFKIGDKKDTSKYKVVVGKNIQKLIMVKPLHRYWKRGLCKSK